MPKKGKGFVSTNCWETSPANVRLWFLWSWSVRVLPVFSEKSIDERSTQKTLGSKTASKKYRRFLWSTSVRQRVEEILGWSVVLMPRGTETLRITLSMLARDSVGLAFWGIAFT